MKQRHAWCLSVLVLTACTESTMQTTGRHTTGAKAGDGVVILAGHMVFPACAAAVMRKQRPDLNFIPEQVFRDALFPWFEREPDSKLFAKMLGMPVVRHRIRELNARYIITVTGTTISEMDQGWPATPEGNDGGKSDGFILCGGGYGAAGCFGLLAWKRKTELLAEVWDLETGIRAGILETRSTGTNVMPAFVLPVPFIAPTEMTACHKLGSSVIRFITSGGAPAIPTGGGITSEAGTEETR